MDQLSQRELDVIREALDEFWRRHRNDDYASRPVSVMNAEVARDLWYRL